MIKNSTKLKNYSIIIMLVITVSFFNLPNTTAAEGNVLSLNHSHDEVWLGAEVDITVTFANDDNIQEVHIHYCWLEPIFRCRPTVEMDKKSGNKWIGTFEVIDDEGKIGYYLDIRYGDGSIKFIPDDFDYLNITEIEEIAPSFFYITIPVVDEPAGSTGNFSDHLARNLALSIGLPVLTISSVIVAIIIVRRKH